MLAQGHNLRLRDQDGSRGRSRTQDKKTRTVSTCWSNPGGLSPKKVPAVNLALRFLTSQRITAIFGGLHPPSLQSRSMSAIPRGELDLCFLRERESRWHDTLASSHVEPTDRSDYAYPRRQISCLKKVEIKWALTCEGQKVLQSPKPRKNQSVEKVTKKWLWGSTRK